MILQYFRFPNGNPEWGIRFPIDFPFAFRHPLFLQTVFWSPERTRDGLIFHTFILKRLMMFRQLASTGEPTITKFEVFLI